MRRAGRLFWSRSAFRSTQQTWEEYQARDQQRENEMKEFYAAAEKKGQLADKNLTLAHQKEVEDRATIRDLEAKVGNLERDMAEKNSRLEALEKELADKRW